MATKRNSIEDRKTEYGIPKFGFKSSFLLIGVATLGCVIIPLLLSFLGINFKLAVILGSTFITPLGIAFSRCFIESDIGFGKTFNKLYIGFGAAFALISIFWTVFNNYI